ncbi:hypothetical protein ONR75_15890 [Rhodopseudomonas sp. P2A-2r]|uniref:hypothetical protein n=1 Tax=Rhodopseudomonas sp. P2A-2r TaxID=2991972 RepID=UPI002233FE54|nr:hypothetical protein [Rhodopseudomonas sp. P2A-2r]UZE51912.1 hypothetical protein ONR75_15890 [Rhodopseudomonas sp. P2A-2r]
MSGFQVSAQEKDPAAFAQAIGELYAGRSNAAGTVTLAAGAASTVVTAPNCAPQCSVLLFPKTANAAAGAAGTFVSTVGIGSFTVSHANNAQTDRTFFYVAIG